MHHKVDVVFFSDGIRWITDLNGEGRLVADDLDKLDEMVKASFSRFLQAKEGDTVIATYRFDNSVMPEWLRQYSDHYFNRVIEFKY